MKYRLIVDKKPRANLTADRREYDIDIEELRFQGDVHDSLVVTVEETYVMRRLSLSEYGVLSVLDTPKKEPLGDLNVQLFEGENYIYFLDMTGNIFYAEYIVKNEFNELYVTNVQMDSAINQNAKEIDLNVSQKLKSYSTTQEMYAAINISAEAIKEEVEKTYATQEALQIEKSERIQSANQIIQTVSKVEKKATDANTNAQNAQEVADEVKAKAISKVDVMYALSTSPTQKPTTGWQTTAPQWENGKYMWQKTITTYGDGSTKETSATCIAGAKGQNGKDGTKGDTGIGVKKIEEQYYLSTSNTAQTGGSWKTTQDAWVADKYIWTRNKITWTDNTTSYTDPVLATGLNTANANAKDAQDTANNTDEKLKDYPTIKSAQSMIDQKAEYVITEVNEKLYSEIGRNSIKNGTFENSLTDWKTSAVSGSVTVQQSGEKKYAQIISKSSWTKLSQIISGLKKGIEYTLIFNAFENGDLEIDLEGGIFQVDITQPKTNSEENIQVISQQIYITKENKTYECKFTLSEETDIELMFSLKNPFASQYTMSVMITGIALCNGINEKISKLDLKSDEIKAGLEKKVDEKTITGAYLILKINDDTSEAKLSADKIELLANDILNILANNQINLESNNIIFVSPKFKTDKNGKVTCSDIEITGGKIVLSDNSSSYDTAMLKFNSSSTKSYMSSKSLEIYNNDLLRGVALVIDGIQGGNQIYAYSENGSTGIGFGEIWTDGNIYASNISSDKRLKENIKKSKVNALNIIKAIKLKSFEWKKDKKHVDIGFIAQELEKIDKNFVLKKPVENKKGKVVDYKYYVNELPIIATQCKAIQEQQEEIQEQQEEIEQLREKDKQKDILIQSLLERIERLEAQNG